MAYKLQIWWNLKIEASWVCENMRFGFFLVCWKFQEEVNLVFFWNYSLDDKLNERRLIDWFIFLRFSLMIYIWLISLIFLERWKLKYFLGKILVWMVVCFCWWKGMLVWIQQKVFWYLSPQEIINWWWFFLSLLVYDWTWFLLIKI